jgi:hypothetical protein
VTGPLAEKFKGDPMKTLIALFAFACACAAQIQPGVYGIERISGTTHMILSPVNSPQQQAIADIATGASGALTLQQGVMATMFSDNPKTIGFDLIIIYQVGPSTLTKALHIDNAPVGNQVASSGVAWLANQSFTILSIQAVEDAPLAQFQFQQ